MVGSNWLTDYNVFDDPNPSPNYYDDEDYDFKDGYSNSKFENYCRDT
jgi:hypothetical protein